MAPEVVTVSEKDEDVGLRICGSGLASGKLTQPHLAPYWARERLARQS